MYNTAMEFVDDMNLVFDIWFLDNAMKFNKRGSEYYKSASKMKKFFADQMK